jgi:hypothetical protein
VHAWLAWGMSCILILSTPSSTIYWYWSFTEGLCLQWRAGIYSHVCCLNKIMVTEWSWDVFLHVKECHFNLVVRKKRRILMYYTFNHQSPLLEGPAKFLSSHDLILFLRLEGRHSGLEIWGGTCICWNEHKQQSFLDHFPLASKSILVRSYGSTCRPVTVDYRWRSTLLFVLLQYSLFSLKLKGG